MVLLILEVVVINRRIREGISLEMVTTSVILVGIVVIEAPTVLRRAVVNC